VCCHSTELAIRPKLGVFVFARRTLQPAARTNERNVAS